MIDYEQYCQIKDYHDHRRLTVAQIARELHLDERTVARWVAAEKFRRRKMSPRPSKLDPYKKQIVRWLVGLGKTHLAIGLGWAACQAGTRVRFATAIDIINGLSAAQKAGRLVKELKQYTRPELLIIDELGYLPIDKHGADLLFQIISQRYERGSIVLTTNKVYKHWPSMFNNDSTLTSAILDRVLHHAETIVIEGKSYRMKDRIDP